jgi:hypothetical protein
VVARARMFRVEVDAFGGGATSEALGAGVGCLMGGGVAFDLISSPCVGTGAGSALVTTGDGGVAGLGIGSATRGAGFGVGREGIEGGCEVAGLERLAGGWGRSACRLVTRDGSVVVLSTGLEGGIEAFSTGLEGGIGPFSTCLEEGIPSLQINLYSSTLNPLSHKVSIISLTPLQPSSSLIPLAFFFLPLQKSAKSRNFVNRSFGMLSLKCRGVVRIV